MNWVAEDVTDWSMVYRYPLLGGAAALATAAQAIKNVADLMSRVPNSDLDGDEQWKDSSQRMRDP